MAASSQIKPAGTVNHVGLQYVSPQTAGEPIEFYDAFDIGVTANKIGEIDGDNSVWKFDEIAPLSTTLLCNGFDLNTLATVFGTPLSWTPTFSGSGSMTYTSVTGTFNYWRIGKIFICPVYMIGTTGGTASTDIRFTLPVTLNNTNARGGSAVSDGGFLAGTWYCDSTTRIAFRRGDGGNFGLGASKSAGAILILQIA